MIFNHSERDYQLLQGINWKNIEYMGKKIDKLEKENTELKEANKQYEEWNAELNKINFLDRQEVEKIIFSSDNIQGIITAICNLGLKIDRDNTCKDCKYRFSALGGESYCANVNSDEIFRPNSNFILNIETDNCKYYEKVGNNE